MVAYLLSVLFVSGVWADCSSSKLFIKSPERMVALSGSCVQIPCSYEVRSEFKPDSRGIFFGVWIKSDPRFGTFPNNVIFNSSKANNTYPMSIIGNLNEKNCTTLFSNLSRSYSDTYFFRIENKQFSATASCNELKIEVQDSPPTPRIEIPRNDLKEGESLNVTCSASTPCPRFPPEISLNLDGDSDHKAEEIANGDVTAKIQKILLSDRHDGLNVTCSAAYPVDGGGNRTAEERKTLRVLYAPKDTSVSSAAAGGWVNLTCSSRGNPPISHFTWFRTGEDGPVNVAKGPVYGSNATGGGVYYCLASNDLGEQRSPEISLNDEAGTIITSTLQATLGATAGIIIFICVVVAVWCFKLNHPTVQQTQSLTPEGPDDKKPGRAKEKEDVRYGVIDFSKRRPETSSSSVLDSGQQQEVLYTQIKMSQTANSSPQSAGSPDAIYAQVKTK
ncbi:myelin-associated glycoprotein [Brachionichthys hirsutus]|uniref:myelin-associated glycoprotein n=1 Tax=Brachionichthys hirsutus TaxID=412623 RepID=UPI0036048E42